MKRYMSHCSTTDEKSENNQITDCKMAANNDLRMGGKLNGPGAHTGG
jgi:hypothetical protein